MRDENSKKSKLSWPKTLVKKWFNIKSKAEDFHADDVVFEGDDEDWSNFSEREACTIKESKTVRPSRRNSELARRSKIDLEASQVTDVHNYRIFVTTWNVAGKSPPSYLNLEDWLHASPPADIYVLGCGYQTPSPIPDPIVELDDDFEGSTRQKASSFFHRRSFQSLSRSMRMADTDMPMPQPRLDRRFSVCDRVMFGHRPSDYDPNYKWGSSDDETGPGDCSPGTVWLLVSKWSGYSSRHLTSGQKEGDELRRNSDVMEILRKTRFPRVHDMGDENSPQTILEHDRIIWLGDLNYRIALSYRSAKALVEMRNWRALLENDQACR
ncbi:DNAse I-like superfamily protein [Actinidia rufa]|uniref:DNAse I-like superfamily protein n=1 Tax=Actinidia rufa TaxID=165716 RepID=A0A7J0FJE1_9ERIC|nr:DNAse I-like superfamily protein [Actinidia rufa]